MRNGGKPPVPPIPLNLGKGLQRKKGTTKPGALARDKKLIKIKKVGGENLEKNQSTD